LPWITSASGPVNGSPGHLGGKVSSVIALYWQDVDAAGERAVAAGAEVIYRLEDQFYGERGGRLRDPSGRQQMMSRHIADVSPGESRSRWPVVPGPGWHPPLGPEMVSVRCRRTSGQRHHAVVGNELGGGLRDRLFLRPTDVDDTALAELRVKVQFAFVRDRGIYVL
jgi:hypothetical protein